MTSSPSTDIRLQAVAHDDGHLVGERRVVGLDGRVDRGEQEAVAVLVLEALAEQRGAPGGGAEQEPAGPGVGGLPDEVADPLEPEHRVEGEERHHRHALRGVRRAGGDEAGHRARLGDALLEDLPGLRLLVGEQQVVVDGLVHLALRRVDAELLEQRVHAEGAGLVGDDRHDPRPEPLVAAQVAQQPGERGGGGRGLLAGAAQHLGERAVGGQLDRAAGRWWCAWGASRRARCGAACRYCAASLSGVEADVRRLAVVGQRLLGDHVLEVQARRGAAAAGRWSSS